MENSISDTILIIPLPQKDFYQELLGDIEFDDKEIAFKKDIKFKNVFAVKRLNIPAGEEKITTFNFKAKVTPRKFVERTRYILDDYKNIDGEIKNLYLSSNEFINSRDPKILSLAKGLVGEKTDVIKILRIFNDYVIKRLAYGNPIKGIYSSLDALEKEKVDCGGFDTLFVSLCVAAGIPARVVFGFFAGYEKNDMHAWVEVFLPSGHWMPLDPSIEHLAQKGLTRKSGHFGFAGSDRIVFSYGCDILINIDGKEYKIDILQNPMVMAKDADNKFEIKTDFITHFNV